MRVDTRSSASRFALLLLIAGCSSPAADPAPVAPAEEAPPARETPSGGDEPSPEPSAPAVPTACSASMDWKPFAFQGPVVAVDAGDDLQAAIDAAPDGAILELAAGDFRATPAAYVDPTCGNCGPSDPKKPQASVGFVVKGKSLLLRGAGKGVTKLTTSAGYGVLVEDACEVHFEGLTITGGKRDADGAAADAAVVARRSRVALIDASIRDNKELMPGNGYPGIAGVMCREGSDVLVLRSELTNNSWDGVAVYRGGHVRVIASKIAGGNGAAVGATWDGRAKIVASDLSRYWKGVGSFQDARVEVHASFVHHNLGWGLWAADRGELVATNDTVAYNDQLGVYLASSTTKGTFVNDLVAYNGANATGAYSPSTFGRGGMRGFAATESPFSIGYVVLFSNQGGDWITPDAQGAVPEASWGATTKALDPKLVSATDLRPAPGSPLLGAGDPAITNADGSRSHIGATGGPYAGMTDP